jgi:RNA polymerase sigma factor (sigma-70 family)
MATHTKVKKKTAQKSATPASKSGKKTSGSSSRSTKVAAKASEIKRPSPDWGDRNPELRRQYIAAEKRQTEAAATGDTRAAARAKRELEAIGREFVVINQGLIHGEASRFNRNTQDDQDNAAAATMGLWEAFLRFDPDRGVAFSTFSRQHISGGVKREVRRNEFQHLSQSEFSLRKQVRLAQAQLASSMGRQPTIDELAERSGLSKSKLLKVLSQASASLDAVIGDDGFTLGDRLEAVVEDENDGESLEALLPALSDQELWVMLQRAGLLGTSGLSLVETADSIGIGREIARRSESRAKVRLAATAIADRTGRLADPTEVAALMGVELEQVQEYLSPSWEDIWARHHRYQHAVNLAVRPHQRELALARLDRNGEEFMVTAMKIIQETAGRYLGENGKPIGVPVATCEIWEAFLSWDPRSIGFTAHLRECLGRCYRRARSAQPQQSYEPADLWALAGRIPASV